MVSYNGFQIDKPHSKNTTIIGKFLGTSLLCSKIMKTAVKKALRFNIDNIIKLHYSRGFLATATENLYQEVTNKPTFAQVKVSD